MHLTGFDPDAFLRDHWQKTPLLIRNPWVAWSNPLDPDELAGLACEEGVESRLITLRRADWTVEQGPLPEDRFGALGKSPYTLLVQAVDHPVPDVAAQLAPFRFIPNWRIDDVMVSYASDGGGVGPHFDQYDVFLIQGLGTRRWQVGALCDDATELRAHDDLRLLAHFEPVHDWLLEPGDILYVPPRIAHNGVAMGDDCMTYSVGFRAPARSELIAHWCDHILDQLDDEDRYADPGLGRQDNPGEIRPEALAALHAMVTEKLSDPAAFARWFGRYTSAPKYGDADRAPAEAPSSADLEAAIRLGTALCRDPASRFAFTRQAHGITLFVDGAAIDCVGDSATLAERMCARDRVVIGPEGGVSQEAIALLVRLVGNGSLSLEGNAG